MCRDSFEASVSHGQNECGLTVGHGQPFTRPRTFILSVMRKIASLAEKGRREVVR